MASRLGRVFVRKYSSLPPPGVKPGDHGPSAAAGELLWKRATFFVAFPALIMGAANVLMHGHDDERVEFIPYEHLRINNKPFPWREDGRKSLFFNPKVNALADGYVD